jgi:hypothetical protein
MSDGQAEVRLPVIHPPRAEAVGMVVCDHDQVGSIKRATAPPADGGQTQNDRAPGHVRTGSRRHLRPVRGWVQGTDVSVAQAVVDEGEQLAGHRDGGDVAAAPFGDA